MVYRSPLYADGVPTFKRPEHYAALAKCIGVTLDDLPAGVDRGDFVRRWAEARRSEAMNPILVNGSHYAPAGSFEEKVQAVRAIICDNCAYDADRAHIGLEELAEGIVAVFSDREDVTHMTADKHAAPFREFVTPTGDTFGLDAWDDDGLPLPDAVAAAEEYRGIGERGRRRGASQG